MKMHKILEKYKINNDPSSQANSNSSFNKSNQSSPHLHKIDGYAKRNKLKTGKIDDTNKGQEVANPK